jgi:hypothetical protein
MRTLAAFVLAFVLLTVISYGSVGCFPEGQSEQRVTAIKKRIDRSEASRFPSRHIIF